MESSRRQGMVKEGDTASVISDNNDVSNEIGSWSLGDFNVSFRFS